MAKPQATGFQPRTTPAERRADIDLKRRISAVAGTVSAGQSYVHHQTVPAAVWTINHTLGYVPNVLAVDSAGDQVEGEMHVVDADTLTLTFSAAFSGTAYLS